MQLQLEHLYQILTQECFSAADRFAPLICTTTQSQYDIVVHNMAQKFKSIVMWDGEIEKGVRQTVLHNMIERTHIDSSSHETVDRMFLDFLSKHASESLNKTLDNFPECVKFSSRVNESGRPIIEQQWLFGPWMPEYALKDALAGLLQVSHYLSFGREERKLKGSELVSLIRTKLKPQECSQYLNFFETFLHVFRHHHLKDNYINNLTHRSSEFDHRSHYFTFQSCLSQKTREQVALFQQEIQCLWDQFSPQRIDILSKHLAQTVWQRCNSMMTSMIDAPMIVSDNHTCVTIDKSSIEQFRAKDPHKEPIEANHFQTPQRV